MNLIDSFVIFVASLVLTCYADINMHNPRGSNNRQDETRRERNNANRLFDSQNNNRGGHNVGPRPGAMTYYSGSTLHIRWANQHSSGDENNNAIVVIQYLCDPNLRDGRTTATPPVRCSRTSCDRDVRFGHHENLTSYEQCASTERNKGLFTANRDLQQDSARNTRQNNAGTRRGYECPQERDYYPTIGNSPWKDVAVFTNDLTKCSLYRNESQNVKSKWACTLPQTYWDAVRGRILNNQGAAPAVVIPSTQQECNGTVTFAGRSYSLVWQEFPAHGLPAPDCLPAQYSRDNHQGNTIGGRFLSYAWTIPRNVDGGLCALRIRYNISTNDYEYWYTNSSDNTERGPREIFESQGLYLFGGCATSPQLTLPFAKIMGSGEGGLTECQGEKRGYRLYNDPELDVFDLREKEKKFRLRLALDTSQYGRVFQDRSHSFRITDRPAYVPENATIHNLNVQGKRGNIVEVYPSVEYDFVPDIMEMTTDDYLHIQWTGSDRNNAGNDGQGRRGTDRNNICQLRERSCSANFGPAQNSLRTNYIRYFVKSDFLGMSEDQLRKLAFSGNFIDRNRPGNLLDRASVYFDNGPVKVNDTGVFHYASSRNNNFSNRDEKGTIIIRRGGNSG